MSKVKNCKPLPREVKQVGEARHGNVIRPIQRCNDLHSENIRQLLCTGFIA